METAVEWLVEHLTEYGVDLLHHEREIQQAKEMEKKQIEDFFNAGVRYGSGSVMSTEWGEDTEEYNFEQYYSETFKNSEQ